MGLLEFTLQVLHHCSEKQRDCQVLYKTLFYALNGVLSFFYVFE